MASIALSRPVNRPVKTCTECKQVKLRCDSRQKFPAPCTRCQARRLHCTVDSSFRRTPARKRVEEMARELEALKSKQGDESGTRSTASPSVDATPPEEPVELFKVATFDYSDLELVTFQLAGITFEREAIIETFKIFAAFYYPHMPIIDSTLSVASLYTASPFLFWTIIAVVSARHILPFHPNIFTMLKDPYLARLRVDILNSPLPLHTIQGLCYIITWPFPVQRQVHEPSWLYSGTTVNAAMYMGLHHPKPLQSLRSIGVVPGSIRARAHTWLGCFLSNTQLSLFNGLAPLINGPSDLETIELFARDHAPPREFVFQVMVQHTLAKFTNVLLNDPRDVITHSIVQLVDGELDGLKTKFPVEITPRVEYSLLVAKLHLYAMTIIRMQSDPTSREILLKHGFSVAVRILYLNDQGLGYKSDDYPNMSFGQISRTLPKNYFRGLVLASVFLLRYFALNTQATPEEQELARNHVALAYNYLKSSSSEPQDEQDRGSRLLENLSRQEPVDIEYTKLRVDNRMGASLVYDALSTYHKIRYSSIEAEDPAPGDIEPIEDQLTAPANSEYPPMDLNANPIQGFGPLDYSLPEDLWGDSMWGMFDVGIPSMPSSQFGA